MPIFSILIPTRNRADLLRYAIQSVLSQDCDDYELIISDNDSSDDTSGTALQFNSPKIRYVTTGRYLTANDSWNYAYTQAKGDYILLIGDDDFLLPSALRHVKRVIQQTAALMICYGFVIFSEAIHQKAESRNTIVTPTREFTNRILKVSTREALKTSFSMGDWEGQGPQKPRPQLHPSSICTSRSIANEISHKYGAFYQPPLADGTANVRSAAYIDFMFVIDKPLVIAGRGSRSMVYKFGTNLNDAWNEHVSELSLVPFKGKYFINLVFECLLKVKHGDPERFKDYDIDMAQYCNMYYSGMMGASASGYDITDDLREFYERLSTMPPDIQTKAREYIRRSEYQGQGGWVVRFLRRSPLYNIDAARVLMSRLYTLYLKTRRVDNSGFWQIVRGDKVGVHDIVSCADHLVDIAKALKQPVDAWDCQKDPTWSE